LYMNKHLGAIFVSISDNKVLLIETNLLAFHKELLKLSNDIPNYQWLSRRFKKDDYFDLTIGDNTFFLQKLTND
jgi:hypothetical protein